MTNTLHTTHNSTPNAVLLRLFHTEFPSIGKGDLIVPELTGARKKKVGYRPYLRNSAVSILFRPNSPAFPLLRVQSDLFQT